MKRAFVNAGKNKVHGTTQKLRRNRQVVREKAETACLVLNVGKLPTIV